MLIYISKNKKQDKKRKTRNNKKKFIQFTKIAVSIVLASAIVWITWSYILATISVVKYGDSQPLESLSKQVCVTLLGTCLGYFIKAFIESYAEHKAEIDQKLLEQIKQNTEDEEIL